MLLRNNRLLVEISEPGAVYRATRFGWTSFITQVTLDGKHTFCQPGDPDPTSEDTSLRNVAGLCNEFGIYAPIGYDEIKPGEKFPKLDVGVLTRESDKPYDFMDPYPFTPYPMEFSHTETSARFIVHPLPCRGYAAKLEKKVQLSSNRISIRYTLHNVGEKPLETTEYNHNFIAVDGHRFGPDYLLEFAFKPDVGPIPSPLSISGTKVRWTEKPTEPYYCRPVGFNGDVGEYWRLTHLPSQVGIRCGGDFPLLSVALWGVAHTACPETFIKINVQPGKTQSWERWYEFFSGE